MSHLVSMDSIGRVQEPPLVPRVKKKKQAKNELDRLKQAEKKRRRLEKALATSAAIRSELEKKKERKKEQERLDEEGAATAEAVALHVLCDDSDDTCQIVLKNDNVDLGLDRDHDSNIGLFMGGWKASVPCSSFGKYSIKGFGWVSDAYGSGCNCNDWGIMWSFAPKMVDRDLQPLYVKEKGGDGEADISPGLIAAQAVSSLQIREDAHGSAFTGEETVTKFVNGMLQGRCLDRNANLYEV